MANKRSRYKKTQKFYCPHCSQRMWRVGGPKYYLFYQGKIEMQKGFKLTAKKASFLASQKPVYVDTNIWLEEFFCENDGQIWMRLYRNENKTIIACLAKSEDWKRTTKTIDPERPHPSASEFTIKMSRNTTRHFDSSQ